MASFVVKKTGGGSTVKGGDYLKETSTPITIDFTGNQIDASASFGAFILGLSRRLHRIKIVQSQLGASGVHILKGVIDNQRIYTLAGGSGQSSLGAVQETISIIGLTHLFLMDVPILRDIDDDPGFYLAGMPETGESADWDMAVVYRSDNEGGVYEEYTALTTAATGGFATTALATVVRPTEWDRMNSVTVKVINGTLSNGSLKDVLNGTNAALLGDEIIGFTTAVDNGDGTYTLSELLRGRRGTEHEIGNHSVGERFVMLSALAFSRPESVTAELNIEHLYRAISVGGVSDGVVTRAFTNTGIGLGPYSVTRPRATRDGSNNIDLTWERRSRTDAGWDITHDSPLSEGSESYEIDVYDPTFTTFKRTLTSSTTTVQYTIGDQTTDFGGAQDPVGFRFFQMSATFGRGVSIDAVL